MLVKRAVVEDPTIKTDHHPNNGQSATMADKSSSQPPERPVSTMAAIKFSERDEVRGWDTLLRYGPVRLFPSGVFICNKEQIRRALPTFHRDGIDFSVRTNLPYRITGEEIRSLADSEGWKTIPPKGDANTKKVGRPRKTKGDGLSSDRESILERLLRDSPRSSR